MPKAVFIKHLVNGHSEVRFLYDDEGVSIMRSLDPLQRQWMPERKCWVIFDPLTAAQCQNMFQMYGWVLNVSEEAQQQEQARARARAKREQEEQRNFNSRRTGNFHDPGPTLDETHYEQVIQAFFRLVPYDRRDELYKAVVKFFHPDTGGDETKMKVLNKVAGR